MRDLPSLEPAAWPVLPKAPESRVVRDLRDMRALLQRGWTGGTLALNRRGRETDPLSVGAVKFCLKGAAIRVTPLPFHPIRRWRLYQALTRAAFVHGYRRFTRMNDAGGPDKAMLAIDTAIAHAQAPRR